MIEHGSITDVPGIKVGHAENLECSDWLYGYSL